MKIKLVYNILPAFIVYSDNMPDWVGGYAKGPYIKLRVKYKNDDGIHQHELTHVKQWYRTFGIHSLLYLFVDKYKQAAEVEAYKVQLNYYDDKEKKLNTFAKFLSTKYGLDLTINKAKELLK